MLFIDGPLSSKNVSTRGAAADDGDVYPCHYGCHVQASFMCKDGPDLQCKVVCKDTYKGPEDTAREKAMKTG